MKRVVSIFGTRPEGIKLYPVIKLLDESKRFESFTVSTGQHKELLSEILAELNWRPTIDLQIMKKKQNPNSVLQLVIKHLSPVLASLKPDLVIVHGDTTSSAASAIAAYNMGIPIAHVEAGLRSNNLDAPWPEEGNRRIIDSISSFLFPPTHFAEKNLARENNPAGICLTGNTGIDALRFTLNSLQNGRAETIHRFYASNYGFQIDEPYILATQHRRENFGLPMTEIFQGIKAIANFGVRVVLCAHPNENVQNVISKVLGRNSNVLVLPAQPYFQFIELMRCAKFIITDSGGVQEEGPSLGKHILVTREVTERPEGVEAGLSTLVGTSSSKLVAKAKKLLQHQPEPNHFTIRSTVYGDGHAAERIIKYLCEET